MIQIYKAPIFEKIAIFDRDDTLIRNVPGLKSINDIQWLPKRLDTLNKVTQLGFDIAIATNQGAVAKGAISISDVKKIHDAIAQNLIDQEINVTSIAFCPHHPMFPGDDGGNCGCRKPLPGLLEEIYISNRGVHSYAIVIGDSETDVEAANRFNLIKTKGILVRLEDDFPEKILTEMLT